MTFLKNILTTGELEIWRRQREWNRQNHQLQYLFWEATLECNFRCEHCGSSFGPEEKRNELSTKEIKKAFSDISRDFDPKEIMVAITGGEPLVRKDLLKVTKHISDLGFSWGLVTNGFLLDQKMAKELKNKGMKTVVVSIDDVGGDHDTFRGVKGAYNKAIAAIHHLAKIGGFSDIQITTTVTKKTINTLDNLYDEFHDLPIDSWRVMGVSPIGRAKENQNLLLNKDEIITLLDFIKEKRSSKDTPFEVTYGCESFLDVEYEGAVRPYFFECRAGINVASILQNGDIFACPNIPRIQDRIQGNVRSDQFKKVWEERFDFFRDPENFKSKECNECEHWKYCEGGSVHLIGNPCFIKC